MAVLRTSGESTGADFCRFCISMEAPGSPGWRFDLWLGVSSCNRLVDSVGSVIVEKGSGVVSPSLNKEGCFWVTFPCPFVEPPCPL